MGNKFLRLLSLMMIVILIVFPVFEAYSRTSSNGIDVKFIRRGYKCLGR